MQTCNPKHTTSLLFIGSSSIWQNPTNTLCLFGLCLSSNPKEKEQTTMSLAPSSYPSLYSSPSLPRTQQTKQNPSSITQPSFISAKSLFLSSNSSSLCCTHVAKRRNFALKASETESTAKTEAGEGGGKEKDGEGNEEEEEKYETYEVEVEQPYGLKFRKGRDGGTYIDAILPGGSADKTGKFTVGDRVIATSAVFGTEIWPAAEYGRTMYTIRQRIGPLLMQMEKRFGKVDDSGELTEKEIIRAERNAGFISSRLREIQMQNYLRKKELKAQREKDLREGLQFSKNGKYEEALERFESVLGSKPTPDEASVASYNVACCYSKLNQVQAGLSALEEALKSGYEDFKRIRTDPDLENIRKSEDFDPLMKQFDESFINESAINAIKSLFGFNKK